MWGVDQTAAFLLAGRASISPPDGALILPKLFRRCTDYLAAVAGGFSGTLSDWLIAVSTSARRLENDLLLLNGETEVALSTVIHQRGRQIRFTADLLDIVFVEKSTGLRPVERGRGRGARVRRRVARLIVLDASVAIAALAADDVHHGAASAALAAATDEELVVAATTRAEILVAPARVGGATFATATNFVDGDQLRRRMRDRSGHVLDHRRRGGAPARRRALSLPDAIAPLVADLIDADAIWTFDRRWSGVDSRACAP